jgi:hypothetical protein
MFLRELFEAAGKTAVIAFGRLNPPTIGHAKLVDAIKSHDGDHYLFLSQTQKPKTDPLDFATKMKFAKQFFPDVNVGHQGVRTPVQALEKMQSLGYTDIIFVAGSDRVDGFQKLFDTYNGQPDKSGNVPFKFNSIKVVSAGERDPDADGAEGMSASKMRAAAAAGDLEAFAQGVPDKKLAQTMYDAVRKGMGVKDAETVEAQGDNPAKVKARLDYLKKHPKYATHGAEKYYADKEAERAKKRKSKYDTQMGLNLEDVSPEDEDKFHNELDNLVHKYFGDSPDEAKMKKKMRKVKEGSPISDLKKIVASKVYKQEYLMALKMMKQEAISAADAARRFMHVDARTLNAMAEKMDI